MGMYSKLDADLIVETIRSIHRRVNERFPESGLSKVAAEMVQISEVTCEQIERIARPRWWLRIASILLVMLLLGVLGAVFFYSNLRADLDGYGEMIQVMEAGLNDLVLIGAVIFFLVSYEGRLRRKKALRHIHELRALAHIIDMHQLTKDPDRLLQEGRGEDTASSPERKLDRFALARYLDYCSEMLACLSKIAALYPQSLDDDSVLNAVDEIEDLTSGLASKIWQKIMILDRTL